MSSQADIHEQMSLPWKWWEWLPLLALGLGLYFFVKNTWSLFGFPLDDAWIHQVYARSFAWGRGFQYNLGVQEAGSTSPLWSIVTSPVHWFVGFGIKTQIVLIKSFGVGCFLAFLVSVQSIARSFTRSRWVGILTVSLLATDPRLLFSSLAGMENILLIALWATALALGVRERRWLALLLWSLMPVTRPETLILLPLGAWLFWPFLKDAPDPRWKRFVRVGLLLSTPMMVWMLFCLMTNGSVLPNTFFVKASTVSVGTTQFQLAWQLLTQHGWNASPLFVVGMVGFALFLRICWARQRRATWFLALGLLVAPVMYLGGVVFSREVFLTGYYWTRWTDPATHLFTAISCFGLVSLAWFVSQRWFGKTQRIETTVGVALVLVTLSFFAQSWSRSFLNRSQQLASDSRAMFLVNIRTGLWLKQNTSSKDVIGVNDAGAIRYFSERRVIDLIGLNEKRIAFGDISRADMMRKVTWMAIFPHWFKSWSEKQVLKEFRAVFAIGIPYREYTLCPCRGQERIVLFRKK